MRNVARRAQTNVVPLRSMAQQNRAVTASLPAPVGGWNARDALGEMDPTDAVTLTNVFPSTTTCNVRFGHTQFSTGLGAQVESLFSYQSGTASRLIAVAGGGFYNISSGGAAPAASVSGLTNSRWQYVNVTTSGGSYIECCNGADNVYTFDGTNWVDQGAAITGVTSSQLININVHKNRIWFCQVGTLKAWYLPTASITGAAAALDLSAFCPHGGYLMAMGTWTIDAGYGVDDHAVFITSEGDVLVYRGTDPASATTWALVGVWWLGSPIGRRCFVKYMGDLLLITQDGLVPLSGALQSSRVNPRVALTDKIQRATSEAVGNYGANFGWQVIPYPNQNMLILNVPVSGGAIQQQFVMNTITGAWCNFTGWYANCWELYGNDIYFGGNGFVGKAWDSNADAGADISWSALQAFNYFGSRGQNKRFTMFRPTFQITGLPMVEGNMAIDFDQTAPSSSLNVVTGAGAAWDSGTWDSGQWGGYNFSRAWQGAAGVGYAAAPNLAGTLNGLELQWISTDVIMEAGGFI